MLVRYPPFCFDDIVLVRAVFRKPVSRAGRCVGMPRTSAACPSRSNVMADGGWLTIGWMLADNQTSPAHVSMPPYVATVGHSWHWGSFSSNHVSAASVEVKTLMCSGSPTCLLVLK